MVNELLFIQAYLEHTLVGGRKRDERGATSTEAVIWVALLAGLALAVGAIIIAKVTTKANGISLG